MEILNIILYFLVFWKELKGIEGKTVIPVFVKRFYETCFTLNQYQYACLWVIVDAEDQYEIHVGYARLIWREQVFCLGVLA